MFAVGLVVAAGVMAVPALAQAKNVLVIGTHPDDEVLLGAGRTRTAFTAGDNIKVVIVTNGDLNGVETGRTRQGEAVFSAQHLGLSEQDIIFLGYPDGAMLTLHDAPTDTTLIASPSPDAQTATYGDRGLGGMEYHRLITGSHGSYTRANIRSDLETLLTDYQPDEIYTHNDIEFHDDHQATALFLAEALVSLKRKGSTLHTKLYQSIVWMPGDLSSPPWPQIDANGWAPRVPFLPATSCGSGDCLSTTPMEWARLINFLQPAEMLLTDSEFNMKSAALPTGPGWFGSFARRDEIFWLKDFGTNVAITATATASSYNLINSQTPDKAVDGVINGWIGTNRYNWVTQEQLAGSWIRLDWAAPVRVSQVNLWGQVNTGDNILAGTLLFSDGTEVAVGAVPTTGKELPVMFAPKTVTWMRFRIDQAAGFAVGLAEIQVLGALAGATANLAPLILKGPVPSVQTITAAQSTNLTVEANDLDGDPLSYQWTAQAGTITGSGPTVLYTPPAVSESTWYAVTVTVTDGRGGSATNSNFVQVTPAPSNSVTVNPGVVFAGNSATGSIVLGTAAPAEGLVVPLTSSAPTIATVPASVSVAAGAFGASFPVTTAGVTTATSVTLTATFAGGPQSTTLSVFPASLTSLSLAPTRVMGGIPSQGTVTLPAPAGEGGVSVALSSSDPAAASVPASVTVPAGALSASFPVSTGQVATVTTVTISATWGTTATAGLEVGPLAVSALTFDPNPVQGGNPAQATVTLNGPAPEGGLVVSLESAAPGTAAVPPSVTVAAGNLTATFAVSTTVVTSSTSVAITARYLTSAVTNNLIVSTYIPAQPNPNLIANPEHIGGQGWSALVAATIQVTVDYAAAPDGTAHASRAVSDGNGHALVFRVGGLTENTTYTFSFFARNNGGAAAAYSVYDDTHAQNIVPPTSYFAQIGPSAFTRISVTFVTPPGCTAVNVYPLRDSDGVVDVLLWGAKLEVGSTATGYAESFSVAPTTVPRGGSAAGLLSLWGPAPAGGIVVALSADGPAVTVPATVTVPTGVTSTTFVITANDVSATTTVTLSAVFPDATRTATLTVTAPDCQCTGTGPGGVPVTVDCGSSACGSDYSTYACSASGWSFVGTPCMPGTGGAGGSGGAGGAGGSGGTGGGSGTCQCTGTGPSGPVTVDCGQSACGSDYYTYACSASGWSWTGASCGGTGGAGGGGGSSGTCQCTGTGPEGPVTVDCGANACGSDFVTYSCSVSGWTWTGASCSGNGGAGGGGGTGGSTGTCQCTGTGPSGPVTVDCGQSACGSDFATYACSAAGWSFVGTSCSGNGGAGGGGGTGGTGGTCQCSGTGPSGPVTVDCGQSACGSDYYSYSCGASGWTPTGQSCGADAGTSDADGGTSCQCVGTGLGGTQVTAPCGGSACGSDSNIYTCNASGWSWTGLPCGG